MLQRMKAVVLEWIMVLLLIFLFVSPGASAQDGDEEADDGTCILSTFCVIILFIFFLIYISSRRKAQDRQYPQGTNPPGYPPGQTGYRYPGPHTYPTRTPAGNRVPPPPKTDIKCNLCNSKNLRVFEDGYYKCNDCRHVFYHTEIARRRR
jgi:hypothetical protein